MKLKIATLLSVAALLGAAAVPASAATLTWNFFTLTGMPATPGSATWTTAWSTQSSPATTATFSQSGSTLMAQSYTSSGCAGGSSWCAGTGDLYARNGGSPDEEGLGLTNDHYPYNEISYPNGIYLNLTHVGHATDVMIGSVQGSSTSGESWEVWGSNNGFSWTPLDSGMGGGIVNFNSASLLGYDQLIIADPSKTPYTNSNDVVLMGITTVPEPGTLALFAAGLLGCALFLRRRARQS